MFSEFHSSSFLLQKKLHVFFSTYFFSLKGNSENIMIYSGQNIK
ncbi:hypothetical protein HMPREF6123_1256 [Oribacterium sinus F0268]|uniref:Uncharacterized protein n=1 Tax=Oribacterium sinus F0268 TaxID=585501 RepID=C2KXN7_9FIRM|nr:hypothetical protein HMPREF6123_1256 [Oribacterium sinus F0268]